MFMAAIREAYKNNDWDAVDKACQDLFGMSIYEEKKKQTKKIVIAESLPVDTGKKIRGKKANSVIVDVPVEAPPAKKKSDEFISTIKRGNREVQEGDKIDCVSEPIDISKNRINFFNDDGTQCRDDVKIDRLLVGNNKPVAREERSAAEVTARCKVCDKPGKVHPMFKEHYRCKGCYK